MLIAFGVIGALSGAVLASCAGRFPARSTQIETAAGALLLGGIALLGFAFPSI